MKYLFLVLLTVLSFSKHAFANADVDYYRQFLYQEEVDDTDPENPIFSSRYLMSEWNKTVPLPNGDSINPTLQLLLRDNFTFTAFYKEMLIMKNGGMMPKGCQKITGTWSVQNGRLMIPGIGYGERATFDGRNAVKITFAEVIMSKEVQGSSSVSDYGFSNYNPEQVPCF